MAVLHPEVLEEIQAIERVFANLATQYAGEGPSQQVLAGALADIDALEEQTPPPFSLPEESSQGSAYSSYLLWAASLLLVGSLALNLYQYTHQQSLSEKVSQLEAVNQDLEEQMRSSGERLALYENPAFQPVYLDGLEGHEGARAIVYFNPSSTEAYLRIEQLPAPSPGEQYQLWTIQGGTPVSAGVLEETRGLISIGKIEGAPQAFAISLEPLGGSETPTPGNILVLGNVG